MKKIKVIISIPDNDCETCPYRGHSSFEYAYHCYEEKDYCKLFSNSKLTKANGKFARCVACQSCEIE